MSRFTLVLLGILILDCICFGMNVLWDALHGQCTYLMGRMVLMLLIFGAVFVFSLMLGMDIRDHQYWRDYDDC